MRETEGVRLLVESDLAVVPIVSDAPGLNIYLVASMMEKRGWNMFTAQQPWVSPCLQPPPPRSKPHRSSRSSRLVLSHGSARRNEALSHDRAALLCAGRACRSAWASNTTT